MYNYTVSILLGAVGVLILVVALVLRSAVKPSEAEPLGEDLLAAAELAKTRTATSNSIPEKPTSAETPKTSSADSDVKIGDEGNSDESTAESSEIIWQESDDVYRPTPVDAKSFVLALGMERTPEIRNKQPYIFIRRPVYEQVRAHLKTNLKVEQGGLLFGQAFIDDARSCYLVMVEAALPATEAQELPNSLTYTRASWQKITPEMQKLNPAWTLIGSYHSHPGMGVFLSGTDLETQAEVFAQDWQIALVVDPVADAAGFFIGKGGEMCPEWYIVGGPATIPMSPPKLSEAAGA